MPYKDPEKRREASRRSAAKHRAKRQAYHYQWYSDPKNRQKKSDYTAAYHQRPGVLEKKREKNQEHYQQNKDLYKSRALKRRTERIAFTDQVALHYSCQNVNCQWKGEFQPHQLAFHHLDPATKVIEVAKMGSHSYDKIVKEINKCVVLCRNCHADVHCGDLTVDSSLLCEVRLEDYLRE